MSRRGKMVEVSISRISSFVIFLGGMLMIVLGLYVFYDVVIRSVILSSGENIFGGLIPSCAVSLR